jgi:2-polyprenyl-6-methoxyphenol hydroxylase-like FAD-dependent oxidoreductase
VSLYKDIPIRPPDRQDAEENRRQAERFGLLCVSDIRYCLIAKYTHQPPDVRQQRLDEDQRCAVAMARMAWRYALRMPEEEQQARKLRRAS